MWKSAIFVLISNDVADLAVIHPLFPILRIPHDFINEISQMENKIDPIALGRAFVLEIIRRYELGSLVRVLKLRTRSVRASDLSREAR